MFRNLVAEPAEVDMLGDVLNVVYERMNVTNPDDRDELARQIVALFASGVTDRNELLNRMGVIR